MLTVINRSSSSVGNGTIIIPTIETTTRASATSACFVSNVRTSPARRRLTASAVRFAATRQEIARAAGQGQAVDEGHGQRLLTSAQGTVGRSLRGGAHRRGSSQALF